MSGFFVTGTDTEIGKTVVAAALLRYLGEAGARCVGMKPVASGAESTSGGLRNDDALALRDAGVVRADYETVNPYVFAEATAPHLAASEQGVTIEPARIRRAYDRLRRQADHVVVEGVGGWLVPLAPDYDVEALARDVALPVVLVVGLRLGCINHALLTERAILASGCRMAGWIANHLSTDFPREAQNVDTLRSAMHTPLLARMPWHDSSVGAGRLADVDEPALLSALGAPTGAHE